jgi:hypothetical protein
MLMETIFDVVIRRDAKVTLHQFINYFKGFVNVIEVYFLVLAGWFFSFAFAAEATTYVVIVPLLTGEGSATFFCCAATLFRE